MEGRRYREFAVTNTPLQSLSLLFDAWLSLAPEKRPGLFLIGRGDLTPIKQAVEQIGGRVVGTREGLFPDRRKEQIPRSTRLIILDLNALHAKGPRSVTVLQAETERIPLLIYSANSDISLIAECYQAGAKAYVLRKDNSVGSGRQLQRAIGIVLTGGLYLPPGLEEALMTRWSQAAWEVSAGDRLTPTERRMTWLIYHGYSKEAIAQELDLQLRSVRTIVSTIRRKLQFSDLDCWRALIDARYPEFAEELRQRNFISEGSAEGD